MKRFLTSTGIGALIGTAIASWVGPPVLVWWWTPPTDLPLSCKKAVAWTAESLLLAQAAGIILGGFFGLLIVYGLFGRKKKEPLPTTTELLK